MLALTRLCKSFDGKPIVRDLSLSIDAGKLLVLLGPSGCGKSTVLRLIAGLEDVDSGDIQLGGRSVVNLPPRDRDVAMVFQSYALYPHMTVRENLAFGLRVRKTAASVITERVSEASTMLGLTDLLERRPAQLSGGQRQRVAIGRAIVRRPQLFLFDEPLSNLDAALRSELRVELARLHRQLGATMVYVTHDQVEAMTLADRIAVLSNGSVEQFGAPIDIYDRPATRFVAGFVGMPPMNFLPQGLLPGEDGVTVGIRPHEWELATDAPDVTCEIDLLEPVGPEVHVYAHTQDTRVVVTLPAARAWGLRVGQTLALRAPPERRHRYDATAGRRIE